MPTFTRRAARRPLLLLAILVGFACGPGANEMGEFFSLFQPEAATHSAADSPYFFSPMLYNDTFGMGGETAINDSTDRVLNANAWATYLDEKVSLSLINKVLTDTSANSSVADDVAETNPAAATYLRFAAQAERAAAHGDLWEDVVADTAALLRLATTARISATAQTDPFLRERYGFQAVKLADEAGDWANSRTAYEQLIDPLPKPSFISDWARCRYAGALVSLGQRDRALLAFAQVFARCPSRRLAAERSVRHQQLRYSDAALALAKTDADRAAVLAICAVQPKQDALPLLKKMVTLDPKNPLLELVLAREINRNEYFLSANEFPGFVGEDATRADSLAFEKRRTNVPDYYRQLLAFSLETAQNKALPNPAFYRTAAAYLQYLNADYVSAEKNLEQANAQNPANTRLVQQIALQQLLLLAAQPGPPDAATETRLISYLIQFSQPNDLESRYSDGHNFRFTSALQAVGSQLANRYLSGAAPTRPTPTGWLAGCQSPKTPPGGAAVTDAAGPQQAKAFLMRLLSAGQSVNTSFGDVARLTLEDTTTVETAQHLVTYLANPTGEFDERLVKLVGMDAATANQLLGRRAISAGQYALAATAFGEVPSGIWQEEAFREATKIDPFSVNMPGEGKPKNPYSPGQFATQLADLMKQSATEKNDDKAAEALYRLGCGAFNLTYYGNAWLLAHRQRSYFEPNAYALPQTRPLNRFLTDPYYVLTTARDYFAQAAKRAVTPELIAKATYMAARCESHALDTRRTIETARLGGYVGDDDAAFDQKMAKIAADADYSTYLNQYRQQNRNTAFAQQMQTRCALYRDIVGE